MREAGCTVRPSENRIASILRIRAIKRVPIRIFHGSTAAEQELNLSMGLVLGLVALPGGFASIFLFDKYGSILQWLRGQEND